jgi:hypothetical protein
MTTPSADRDAAAVPARGPAHDDGSVDAAEVTATREEFADTLDAIEEKLNVVHRWQDLQARVRSRYAEEPVTVAAVAVAAASVVALAAFLVVRAARR